MGQTPKEFGRHGQGRRLFVTEQMVELWEDMRGDQEFTYRRVLSSPMGVGKSYFSYFLAAKAYSEGWLVLYMSDAGLLDKNDENESALEVVAIVVKRFLALNKDILTGAELEMLVNDYNGTRNILRNAISVIFRTLLMSRDRKTLLLVDEHGKLFEQEPYVPDKFKSLVPLKSYHWWGEDAKGSRVVFTGTAHAKYEMTILDDSYRPKSVVFVGPLSKPVFYKLLDTYPRLSASAIREEVTAITNCVPRELVHLSATVEHLPDPTTMDNLQQWVESQTEYFLTTAKITTKVAVRLIYRKKDVGRIGTQHHILCRPAQRCDSILDHSALPSSYAFSYASNYASNPSLLELFKTLPLPKDTRRRICDGSLGGDDFETALFHQPMCTTKPIVLNATDLNGRNPTAILLDFAHCDTLQIGKVSLESGRKNFLTRGYEGYPRFDFMLGPLFIQTSISDFGQHNKKDSADIRKAFNDRDSEGANQIERYLNDVFGPGHSAKIEDNRFIVTKDGVPVPGFRIVYCTHAHNAINFLKSKKN
ncbi:hypothetical protein BGZ47_006926 [Haplosporangium gracile]|nr:hypothetical protein BGZ47_006926 [Haplosporangium gracile]